MSEGKISCRKVFLFLHDINEKRYKAIREHFRLNDLIPRKHGNKGKLPHNTLDLDVVSHTRLYLCNHGAVNSLVLPGLVACHQDDQLILLPSHHTMKYVYRNYQKSCLAS